jgi:hypothetical protein
LSCQSKRHYELLCPNSAHHGWHCVASSACAAHPAF